MKPWLTLSNAIDEIGRYVSMIASWAVLFSALISAGNAFVRFAFDQSSNGWLEIQWYLFAWMVMVGAPYVLKVNEHVRVDILYSKLKNQKPVWMDLFGLIFFLLPVMGFMFWFSLPYAEKIFITQEMSQNAGGLIRWPAVWAIPVGFGMMFLQGISEIIKRIAHLRGDLIMDTHYEKPLQ